MNLINNFKVSGLFFIMLQLFSISISAQIKWSEEQLLPSFPNVAETQDLFWLSNKSKEERYLLSSLKGIVNLTQPRMLVYDGDALAEGAYSWLNSLGFNYVEYNDNWQLNIRMK